MIWPHITANIPFPALPSLSILGVEGFKQRVGP